MRKKLFIMTCASFLIFPTFAIQAENEKSAPSNEKEVEEQDDKVSSLKEESKTIETNKESIKQEISQINQYIDATEKIVMDIQTQLNATNSKIEESESEIKKLTGQLSQIQQQIIQKEKEIQEQKIKLGKILAFRYENRDFGFFQFMFQTEKISDTFKSIDFINIILEENNKLYNDIKKQEAALQNKKSSFVTTKTKIEQHKTSLVALKQQQESQKSQQDSVLTQYKTREIEMITKLEEEEIASQQIMTEINKALSSIVPNQGTEEVPLEPDQKLVSPMSAGSYYISSVYGYRIHPVLGYGRLHNGLDFAAPMGTPIYSAGTGTVIFSGPSTGYGNWIVIQHDNGLFSIYGHMESNTLYVSPGERVNQSQVISAVGSSGLSSGPHLHLSVATSFDGNEFKYVDPLEVLQ